MQNNASPHNLDGDTHQDTNLDTCLDTKEQLRARGICVIVPTYNNAGTILAVVADVLRYCQDVIVVNDGCTDNTAVLLDNLSDNLFGEQKGDNTGSRLTVVGYAQNRGKGHALKTGFRKAQEMGFAYAITLDADGQHFAKDIPLFLEANIAHPGALIVGARQLEGVDRSKGSSFANKFSNFWFAVQTGHCLPDTQTGYRLYPLKHLTGLALLTNRYEAELMLMVSASWHGTELVSIPIDVYYPPREERVSHFRPGWDFFRISVLNTVLCLLAVVYALPLAIVRGLIVAVRTIYSLLAFSLLAFLVILPVTWFTLKIGKMTDAKRQKLRNIIYRSARFITLTHGVPGATFTHSMPDGTDLGTPRVVVANHQSHLDLIFMLSLTPNMVFLTNRWVWRNPFYGLLIRNAEYLPAEEGLDNLLPKMRGLTERGLSIAVFPEGTRSRDCRIGRFHKGAFHIAQQLGLDVLPMTLYGPGRVLKKDTYYLGRSRVHVAVQHPIGRTELDAMGSEQAQASAVRKICMRQYSQLANQLDQNA